ncbi:Uncharacterized protein TCM_043288 [Theobroma cacao]|uniref:Uncharacterized protein n=1 Tax=Theobroma cacao TaxID=3641 RepID=A0A061FVH7_THECC|nr:Uncharacterized protein TCM_043288 [Theobroma cacao]
MGPIGDWNVRADGWRSLNGDVRSLRVMLEPSGCYGACERWSANKIKELEKENVVVWGREVLIKVVACAVLHTLWLASNLERSFLRE